VDLFGHRSAADDRPPFEHQRLQPGLAEISGCGQSVVTSADHDGIVGLSHWADLWLEDGPGFQAMNIETRT
jgi:hypothetical protein